MGWTLGMPILLARNSCARWAGNTWTLARCRPTKLTMSSGFGTKHVELHAILTSNQPYDIENNLQ
jgi:hypothetical protein